MNREGLSSNEKIYKKGADARINSSSQAFSKWRTIFLNAASSFK